MINSRSEMSDFFYSVFKKCHIAVIIKQMDYSKAIKELRDKLIISQEDLAKMLGVSFASVNRWERGHHEPTLSAKRKLRVLFIKNSIKTEE